MTEIAMRPAAPQARASALAGLRVVEMGFAAAGPLVGKYLANFGAEVIRLESRLAADVFRTTYPPFKDGIVEPDRAGMFAFYNDGKRSATLNLKHPKGVALARALIGQADVFVESFTPGTVARLGLGAETLRADHPELIILSSCNQGQTGPHAFHPGYGSQLSALAGFVQLLGEPESTPVLLYGPYIDYVAVGYGAIAVLAALERRKRTGTVRARVVDGRGRPLAGALVRVTGAGLKRRAKRTNVTGQVTFKVRPTKRGKLVFSASKAGFQPAYGALKVR